MALPKIDVPTFQLNVDSVGKKVKFRPFLVKEEKLLVMAQESTDSKDILNTAQQIITNCSFGKLDGDKLPLYDLQKVFLDLRSQSIGQYIDLKANCVHCGEVNDVLMDLNEINIVKSDDHKSRIELGSEIIIDMKYPSVEEISDLVSAEIENDIYHVAANSIKTIYYGDEVIDFQTNPPEERIEWVENLSQKQFAEIKNFFETMPQLYHTIEFKCKHCNEDNTLVIDGYENFFV